MLVIVRKKNEGQRQRQRTEMTADQVSLIILSRSRSGEDRRKAEEIGNLTPTSGNWEQRGDKQQRSETVIRSRSQLMCWTLA